MLKSSRKENKHFDSCFSLKAIVLKFYLLRIIRKISCSRSRWELGDHISNKFPWDADGFDSRTKLSVQLS